MQKTVKQRRSVSFHHPPADASLQMQWLDAIPLTNTPTSSKRMPMFAESTSLGDVDRVVFQPKARTFLPDSEVHCLTVCGLICRDQYISTLTRTWKSHCRQ